MTFAFSAFCVSNREMRESFCPFREVDTGRDCGWSALQESSCCGLTDQDQLFLESLQLCVLACKHSLRLRSSRDFLLKVIDLRLSDQQFLLQGLSVSFPLRADDAGPQAGDEGRYVQNCKEKKRKRRISTVPVPQPTMIGRCVSSALSARPALPELLREALECSCGCWEYRADL